MVCISRHDTVYDSYSLTIGATLFYEVTFCLAINVVIFFEGRRRRATGNIYWPFSVTPYTALSCIFAALSLLV